MSEKTTIETELVMRQTASLSQSVEKDLQAPDRSIASLLGCEPQEQAEEQDEASL